jgi:hypothetical protein
MIVEAPFESATMAVIAKDPKKKPNRSPAWIINVRVDPALEEAVAAYRETFEYPPSLTQVIERALKELLRESGTWPPKDQDDR